MLDEFRQNLINKIGEENLLKIEQAKIGLAGAGGLGSNCALNLVRVGFKRLKIVDFDVVTAANLDRQFYFIDQVGMFKVEALKINLLRVNPNLELEMINQKIEKPDIKNLFKDCDCVVECLDRAEYKRMLVEEALRLGEFVVSASGLGGIGSSDEIRVHRRNKNLAIIGDLKSDISKTPALSPRVNVSAAKQADVILEFVLTEKIHKKFTLA